MPKEVLEFADLQPYLMLKNGNFLYKVPYRDGVAVLKVYYGSRGTWGRIRKSFSNVVLYGQTSYMPKTRCRIERECLALWQKHGFRTFEVYDVEVRAPSCVPGGYLLLEYVDAPTLDNYMLNAEIPVDERFARYRDWLPEWSRRHDVAIAEREPKLLHENGDLGHVMLPESGGYLWLDFEMVYRSAAKVEDYVGHEIVQYVWNLHRMLPEDLRQRFIDETVNGYPVRDRIQLAHDYFHAHHNPFYRAARVIDSNRKRSRKPTSKYAVAKKLLQSLAGA